MSIEVVRDLRERLCRVGKQLYDHGLVTGTVGNVSARVPSSETVLIKLTGVCMGFLKPEDFILVDMQGKQIEGKQTMSVETPMHTAVYRVRSDVNGVVHSHAPTATAFGISGIEILPMAIETFMFIPKGVPIVPFEMPGSKELAEAVEKKIKEYDAVILENHGILTVGSTIEDACSLNMTVEETARLQFMVTLLAGRDAITMETVKKKYGI
jgi:L-ribulose-5-phosphate 4-epimerase